MNTTVSWGHFCGHGLDILWSSCHSHSFMLSLLFQAAGMKRRRRRRRRRCGLLEEEEVCTWMSSWILMLHLTVDSVWRTSTLWSTTWTESWPSRSTSVCRGGGGGGDFQEQQGGCFWHQDRLKTSHHVWVKKKEMFRYKDLFRFSASKLLIK